VKFFLGIDSFPIQNVQRVDKTLLESSLSQIQKSIETLQIQVNEKSTQLSSIIGNQPIEVLYQPHNEEQISTLILQLKALNSKIKQFNKIFITDIKPWTKQTLSISQPTQEKFDSVLSKTHALYQSYKQVLDNIHTIKNSYLSSTSIKLEEVLETNEELGESAVFAITKNITVLENAIKRRQLISKTNSK